VLEQEDRVVVVKVHLPTCLNPALYRVPHRLGAVDDNDLRGGAVEALPGTSVTPSASETGSLVNIAAITSLHQ
jgi:hypothetical protein